MIGTYGLSGITGGIEEAAENIRTREQKAAEEQRARESHEMSQRRGEVGIEATEQAIEHAESQERRSGEKFGIYKDEAQYKKDTRKTPEEVEYERGLDIQSKEQGLEEGGLKIDAAKIRQQGARLQLENAKREAEIAELLQGAKTDEARLAAAQRISALQRDMYGEIYQMSKWDSRSAARIYNDMMGNKVTTADDVVIEKNADGEKVLRIVDAQGNVVVDPDHGPAEWKYDEVEKAFGAGSWSPITKGTEGFYRQGADGKLEVQDLQSMSVKGGGDDPATVKEATAIMERLKSLPENARKGEDELWLEAYGIATTKTSTSPADAIGKYEQEVMKKVMEYVWDVEDRGNAQTIVDDMVKAFRDRYYPDFRLKGIDQPSSGVRIGTNRPRYQNPETGEIVEWTGSEYKKVGGIAQGR